MYLVIADGEQALIIASRSLGQENGPTVRRLVERNHANRNIEGNLGACLKEKELAEYLSQWYKFINSETQIEAETSMAFMQQMFSKHEDSVQKKLKSTFKVYFEEPRMVCKFGLEGVPSKHFGPAESEGYQNLFKNVYTEKLNNNSPPDDVLYQAFLLRKKLALRFFEDYTNGKLPKAMEFVRQKYMKEQNIDFDPQSGKAISAKTTRKSPRKLFEGKHKGHDLTGTESKKARKNLFDPQIIVSPSVNRTLSGIFERSGTESGRSERSLSMFRAPDADGNVPYVGQLGCSTTQFSKKPQTRKLQRKRIMRKYKDTIENRMMELEDQILKNRQRYTLQELSSQDFATAGSDGEPESLVQFIDECESNSELLTVEDIALVASTYEPKYKVWESLKAIEVDEDTKFVAEDRYFNLNMGSSVAAAVNLFFEKCIRGSTDKTTIVKKIAFQYVLRDKSEVPYITLVAMTNRGLVGNKYDPFIFQFVLPAGKLLESNIGNNTKCEGCGI